MYGAYDVCQSHVRVWGPLWILTHICLLSQTSTSSPGACREVATAVRTFYPKMPMVVRAHVGAPG